jgi:hypothetical protein
MGSFDAKKPPSKISCLGTFNLARDQWPEMRRWPLPLTLSSCITPLATFYEDDTMPFQRWAPESAKKLAF